MAHNITNGRDIAFMGSRRDIWHRLGTEMTAGASIADWASAAGLGWTAEAGDAYFAGKDGCMVKVEGCKHYYRSDNQGELGYATNVSKPVQPIQTLEWLQEQIDADSRFQLDVAGSLRGGRSIWATAIFKDEIIVGGDKHRARLLMSTSFDQSYATDNRATMTRVICNNTLDGALAHGGNASVRTRHSSKWDSKKVSLQLGNIIQQFDNYKRMGDAMVNIHLTNDQNEQFARKLLGLDNKADADINTRKLNQLNDIRSAYAATVAEGTEPNTAWAMLNSITRYVDHDRGTRDMGHGETESRFFSAQFSSGAALKSKAVGMLYELNDGELLRACVAATEANRGISRALQQPLMVR